MGVIVIPVVKTKLDYSSGNLDAARKDFSCSGLVFDVVHTISSGIPLAGS